MPSCTPKPYMPRFYYLPRVPFSIEGDQREVLRPCDNIWKVEGTSLEPELNQSVTEDVKTLQDLPQSQKLKQTEYRKLLRALNKMTDQNLEKQVEEMGVGTMDANTARMLAEVLFSKAVREELYIGLYGDLYSAIVDKLISRDSAVLNSFTRSLARLCNSGVHHVKHLKDEDLNRMADEQMLIYKKNLMTMMRLYGELVSAEKPLFGSSTALRLCQDLVNRGQNVTLEAVHSLLQTVIKRQPLTPWVRCDGLWSEFASLSKGYSDLHHRSVPHRIRFMFLQLVEHRIATLPSPSIFEIAAAV